MKAEIKSQVCYGDKKRDTTIEALDDHYSKEISSVIDNEFKELDRDARLLLSWASIRDHKEILALADALVGVSGLRIENHYSDWGRILAILLRCDTSTFRAKLTDLITDLKELESGEKAGDDDTPVDVAKNSKRAIEL